MRHGQLGIIVVDGLVDWMCALPGGQMRAWRLLGMLQSCVNIVGVVLSCNLGLLD